MMPESDGGEEEIFASNALSAAVKMRKKRFVPMLRSIISGN